MKPIPNYSAVPSRSHRGKLPVGGYVCKLTEVSDVPKKEYLNILFDIAEGTEAGRFADDYYRDKPYLHRFMRSYKDTAKEMFKEFTDAIDASNGTDLTPQVEKGLDEMTLVGKLIGLVLAEEEYENDRGEVKVRQYVAQCLDAASIREGAYKVPELKKLKRDGMVPAPEVSFGAPVDDDNLPF